MSGSWYYGIIMRILTERERERERERDVGLSVLNKR